MVMVMEMVIDLSLLLELVTLVVRIPLLLLIRSCCPGWMFVRVFVYDEFRSFYVCLLSARKKPLLGLSGKSQCFHMTLRTVRQNQNQNLKKAQKVDVTATMTSSTC